MAKTPHCFSFFDIVFLQVFLFAHYMVNSPIPASDDDDDGDDGDDGDDDVGDKVVDVDDDDDDDDDGDYDDQVTEERSLYSHPPHPAVYHNKASKPRRPLEKVYHYMTILI